MGWGQSNTVKRLNTTPIVRRDDKIENEKENGEQWHISNNENSERRDPPNEWNFAGDLSGKYIKSAIFEPPLTFLYFLIFR